MASVLIILKTRWQFLDRSCLRIWRTARATTPVGPQESVGTKIKNFSWIAHFSRVGCAEKIEFVGDNWARNRKRRRTTECSRDITQSNGIEIREVISARSRACFHRGTCTYIAGRCACACNEPGIYIAHSGIDDDIVGNNYDLWQSSRVTGWCIARCDVSPNARRAIDADKLCR